MNKITFNEYKRAIRTQYEKKKIEDVTGILMNPSPAQLRNLCLILFDKSLSNNDEKTMKLFFNVKEEESLRKAIEKCEISRFRPIQSFLRGEKDSENMTRIELAAILVDYNSRPYKKYMQVGDGMPIRDILISLPEEQIDIVNDVDDLEEFNEGGVVIQDNKTIKSIISFLMVLLSLFFMGYTIKDIISPTKECMQWKMNHYEAVDCTTDDKLGAVIPNDKKMMELKKLDSKAALVFFKNDKPIVWYSKENGRIELFNQPGFHPETEKPLKPITDYIIHKYKLKEKE
jgi:hypothetical protein